MEDGLEKEQCSWPLDDALEKEEAFLALGSVRCRKECWHPLSPPWTFGSSWPNLLLGLVKPNFSNSTTHYLTYYSRKQGLNNGPILLLFYCSLIHLFKSSHLLWLMWRVWEVHVDLGHVGWSLIGSFWACRLLLGLLMGLDLKVYLGLMLGLLGSHQLSSCPSNQTSNLSWFKALGEDGVGGVEFSSSKGVVLYLLGMVNCRFGSCYRIGMPMRDTYACIYRINMLILKISQLICTNFLVLMKDYLVPF